MTPVVSHSTGSEPTISESDRTKYANMFMACGPVSGLLDGDKAREVFLKSKLPVDKLSQIWYVRVKRDHVHKERLFLQTILTCIINYY